MHPFTYVSIFTCGVYILTGVKIYLLCIHMGFYPMGVFLKFACIQTPDTWQECSESTTYAAIDTINPLNKGSNVGELK